MNGKDGYEKLENGRWRDRWRDKLEGQKRGTGGTKLLPEHTVRRGSKKPKNGLKYRKLTLSVQLFRGNYQPQSPVNSGFCVYGECF